MSFRRASRSNGQEGLGCQMMCFVALDSQTLEEHGDRHARIVSGHVLSENTSNDQGGHSESEVQGCVDRLHAKAALIDSRLDVVPASALHLLVQLTAD